MESFKSLLTRRAKLIHDAQAILGRGKAENRQLHAEEHNQADELLNQAEALDREIEKRQSDGKLADRAQSLADRSAQEVERLTAFSIPGSNPGNTPRGDEPLVIEVGRGTVSLSPGTPEYGRAQLPYRQAFARYLCGGGRPEQLGLQVSKDPKGGYLAPPQFVAMVIKFLDDLVFMRQLCTVLPPMPTAVSIGVPVYTSDPGDADWTAEIPSADIAEDDNMLFGKRDFMPHLFTKLVKASRKLIRSAVLDIEAWVAQRLAYKFAITEEKAFLTGDGNQKPLGAFTASADGMPAANDTVAAANNAIAYDDLVNCLEAIKVAYQKNSTWMANREFVKRCRKLKNSQGDPLWSGGFNGVGLVTGIPDTILGRPYVISEYVPNTYTTGLYVAALADWKSLYWIGDSLELAVEYIDQLFTLRNQVGFLGRKETDGAVVLPEAGTRLKLA